MRPSPSRTERQDRVAIGMMLAAGLWTCGAGCTGTAPEEDTTADSQAAVEEAISRIGDALERISACTGIDQRLTADQIMAALEQQHGTLEDTTTFESFVAGQAEITAVLADVQCGLSPGQDPDADDIDSPP